MHLLCHSHLALPSPPPPSLPHPQVVGYAEKKLEFVCEMDYPPPPFLPQLLITAGTAWLVGALPGALGEQSFNSSCDTEKGAIALLSFFVQFYSLHVRRKQWTSFPHAIQSPCKSVNSYHLQMFSVKVCSPYWASLRKLICCLPFVVVVVVCSWVWAQAMHLHTIKDLGQLNVLGGDDFSAYIREELGTFFSPF